MVDANHDGEQGECRPNPDHWEEILEHYKTVAAKAQAESDALSDRPDLLAAASLAHNLYAQVVMTCTSNAENNAAALELAESELRIAVTQDPRSLKAITDLATCLMKAKKSANAIETFKLALTIKPNYSYAMASLKSLEIYEKQVN